ncbi:hypothetical protein [Micromonospora sp. WMMD736]|uniref:hypothetical protein n=1 Tax=Micromonospora sp. WMMD736 TaxID=3404112 RepID=UPI003B9472C1
MGLPVKAKRASCAFTSVSHHSRDRVRVYHGKPDPVVLCGYHASDAWIKEALKFVSEGKN